MSHRKLKSTKYISSNPVPMNGVSTYPVPTLTRLSELLMEKERIEPKLEDLPLANAVAVEQRLSEIDDEIESLTSEPEETENTENTAIDSQIAELEKSLEELQDLRKIVDKHIKTTPGKVAAVRLLGETINSVNRRLRLIDSKMSWIKDKLSKANQEKSEKIRQIANNLIIMGYSRKDTQ
jgi:chromosome segregation ATPase